MQNASPKQLSIRLERLGPISDARVNFGDLTVLVGPQASGKSLLLQTLKLAMDRDHIIAFLASQSVSTGGDPHAFLDLYYGRGMGGMIDEVEPRVTWAGQKYSLVDLTKATRRKRSVVAKESLFYIPAQRVVSLPSGRTKPFGSYDFGDPYVLRYFSHQIHYLLQNEFGRISQLFPAPQRLNNTLKELIAESLFGKATLSTTPEDYTKSMTLKVPGLSQGLPYLAWSAGQREFVPLLLGLYWLCPPGAQSRRECIEWVVIEEPEMGLHPHAIETFLVLTLELIRRGYRVVISSHSPIVLDLAWAVKALKSENGTEKDIRDVLRLPSNNFTKSIAAKALSSDFLSYYVRRDGEVAEISSLDVNSDDVEVSEWGHLTSFPSRAEAVVSRAVRKNQLELFPDDA